MCTASEAPDEDGGSEELPDTRARIKPSLPKKKPAPKFATSADPRPTIGGDLDVPDVDADFQKILSTSPQPLASSALAGAMSSGNGLILQSCWIPAPLNPFQPNNSLSYARLPGLPGSGQYLITDNDELFNGSPLLVIDTADCHNGRPVTPVAQYAKARGMTGIDFEWMGLIYTEVFQFWNGGDQPFADNTYLGLNGTTYMEDISVCGFRAKFGGGGNDGCPYP